MSAAEWVEPLEKAIALIDPAARQDRLAQRKDKLTVVRSVQVNPSETARSSFCSMQETIQNPWKKSKEPSRLQIYSTTSSKSWFKHLCGLGWIHLMRTSLIEPTWPCYMTI